MNGISSIINGVERFGITYPYLGVLISKFKKLVIVEKGTVIGLGHKFVPGEACPCCGARISDIERETCSLCDWQGFGAIS